MKMQFKVIGLAVATGMILVLNQNCSGGLGAANQSSNSTQSPAPASQPGPGPAPGPAPMPAPIPAVQGAFASLPQTNTIAGRWTHAYAAFGNKLFVFGSRNPVIAEGTIFDNATGTWTPVNTTGSLEPRYGARAVYTGSKIIVFGGVAVGVGSTNTGAIYDPATNTWAPFPQTNTIPTRALHAMAYMNGKIFVFGGYYEEVGSGFGSRNDGYVYDMATQTWSAISLTGAPPATERLNAIYTGSKILIFGGCSAAHVSNVLYQFDPATNLWSTINAAGPPSARCGNSLVWNGREMIAFGGSSTFISGSLNVTPLNDAGAFDPATNTWRLFAGPAGAMSARTDHAAAWLSDKMIIWSGLTANGAATSMPSTGYLFN